MIGKGTLASPITETQFMFNHTEFRKQRLFGIDFDVVTMRQAVDWVYRNVAIGWQSETKYVVTPNVNLTMTHQKSAEFRKYVHHAALTIVDGAPLVTASKWLGKPLPERVAGSDLVLELFDAAIAECPLRVFMLGAAPGVAERAADIVRSRWPAVEVVGTLSPPLGFEKDAAQNRAIIERINGTDADVLLIGLGAPKQEAWAYQHREQIRVPVTLCVGGTIDFIAGEQRRAPKWVRRVNAEWVWRMMTNPRRLLGRYVGDAIRLPRLLVDELAGRCPVWQANANDRQHMKGAYIEGTDTPGSPKGVTPRDVQHGGQSS